MYFRECSRHLQSSIYREVKIISPKSFNDLRPIRILPTLSKIVEKIVMKLIENYTCNILPTLQSGFRKGFSTIRTLNIIDDITSYIDNNQLVLLVLLDFIKTFDTINHELLLSKLKLLGFSNNILFFRNYKSNRSHVQYNNYVSESLEIMKYVFVVLWLFHYIYISFMETS